MDGWNHDILDGLNSPESVFSLTKNSFIFDQALYSFGNEPVREEAQQVYRSGVYRDEIHNVNSRHTMDGFKTF